MANDWMCSRCSFVNQESRVSCARCGLVQGSVDSPTGSGAPPVDSDTLADAAATPPATLAPVRVWRRIPIGLVLFLIICIGSGIAIWFLATGRLDTGELTATDLRVGDCFDLDDRTAEKLDEVAARPCAQAHRFELFFTGSLPEGAFPPQSVIDVFVQSNCGPAFLTYVGTSYEQSQLDVYWMAPTSDTWDQGHRAVQCAVYDPGIDKLTESLKGSKR